MPHFAKNSFQQGFSHILVLVAVVVLGGLVVSANTTTTKEFPASLASQNVLGEDEVAKKAEEQAKESAKKAEEVKKEGSKSKTESVSSTGVKIKTKVEDDGTTKVEIEKGKLKLKYKLEGGQIKLKAENEQGKEVELEDEELDEMENEAEEELEKKGIKIATGSGKPVLAKNNVAALTDFPLSVDVATNQLIVTTPQGQKVVTILPDQAVQNLLATNIINKVDSAADPALSELGQLSGVVKLEIKNDKVVYKVKGVKSHRFLGFIPVDTSTTAFVSSETGNLVAQEQSLLANIVDVLSP